MENSDETKIGFSRKKHGDRFCFVNGEEMIKFREKLRLCKEIIIEGYKEGKKWMFFPSFCLSVILFLLGVCAWLLDGWQGKLALSDIFWLLLNAGLTALWIRRFWEVIGLSLKNTLRIKAWRRKRGELYP